MRDKIYVIGHRNPDTDSICSAIAYAALKKREGFDAEARRLGSISRETAFVLEHFGIGRPDYLPTVRTQVLDLEMDQTDPVLPGTSVKTTWEIMKTRSVKTVPVADGNGLLLGLVSVSDITDEYMDAHERNTIASTATPLPAIAETLEGSVLSPGGPELRLSGRIAIAATDPDEMGSYINAGDIVIAGNRADSQEKALQAGASCLVVTCGVAPERRIMEQAETFGSAILLTPYDTFTTARLINLSIPASAIMKSDGIVSFQETDFIDDVQEKMLRTRYRSYPVVDAKGAVRGFISRYHLIRRKRKNVILVDHNELSQTVDGIEQADILEIIDHHRLGDIQTIQPIHVQSEPVGSTATIVANRYFSGNVPLEPAMAGILCAAILSDTIGFRSPTGTPKDRETAERLAAIAAIPELDAFAERMFREGSSLAGMSPLDIIHQDFKEYTFEKRRIGLAQIFTVDQDGVRVLADELSVCMEDMCRQNGYDLLMLFATDVLREGSLVLCAGRGRHIAEGAFGLPAGECGAFLPGIVSRKKQVVPLIAAALMEA